jgi:cytochrome bd ubiquinol oxidase subunit I
MSVLALSRLQFAVTIIFHFLFVPLTLGLSWLIAWWEMRFARSGEEACLRQARFWGRLFLINFALGIVTGIAMEFQFGMNWAEFSRFVGDVFGAPLAIEATAAFFLESTLIGLWIFGWKKISRKAHAWVMVLIAFATNLSALWIILANAWQQHPVGYVLRNGRAEMTDFRALLANPNGWSMFAHTLLSGFACAGFFVMGVSAYHLRRKNETDFFRRSFRAAAAFALAASLLVALSGDRNGVLAARFQPAKLAAMETHWETAAGAPFTVFAWPDAGGEKNAFSFLKIPNGLSLMAYHKAKAAVRGLKDFPPDERPPVWPVFLSFRLMVALGLLMILLSFLGWRMARRNLWQKNPRLLRALPWAIPLPYLAIQLGWIVTEVGRQPWIVHGLMRTSDGVSQAVSAGQVGFSLGGFALLYGGLAAADLILLRRAARKGPAAV